MKWRQILLVLISCYPVTAFSLSADFHRVFTHAMKGLTSHFWQSVEVKKNPNCLAGDGGFFYGSPKVGFFAAEPVENLESYQFRLLPLTYHSPVELWCKGKTKNHRLHSFQSKKPNLPFLDEISPKLLSGSLPTFFMAGIASVDTIDPDFVDHEEKKHIGMPYIANKWGEILWASVPNVRGKPLHLTLSPHILDEILLVFGKEGSFEIDGAGKIVKFDSSKHLKLVHRSPDQSFIKVYDSSKFVRRNWGDFIYGPRQFEVSNVFSGRLEKAKKQVLDTASLLFRDESIVDARVRDIDYGPGGLIYLAHGSNVIYASQGSHWDSFEIHGEDSGASLRLRWGVDGGVWVLRVQDVGLVLKRLKLDHRKNKIKDQGLAYQIPCASRGNSRILKVADSKIWVFCQESDPRRFEIHESGDDRIISINLKTKEVVDEMVLPQSFYSQQRDVAFSSGVFGLKFIGDQIESI